jgi:N-acetylneuraminic acid mutarotase
MSLRRSYIAAAEVAGSVYAAGGMVGETGRPLAVFQRYDPRQNRWSTLRPLPEPVRAGAGAAVGDTVYVTGGQTPSARVGRQVYAYDVGGGTWRAVAPLPEARFNHSAVTLGGTVYVLGGFADETEQDEVFAYDARADRWSLVTRLPRPMHAFGAVAFRGELWTIGGIEGEEVLDDVWIWSPRSARWRRGPTLPEPMELLGAAVAGDEIHAVWEGVYQVYDARAGAWRRGPSPSVTRHGLEAFALDGALYAIGGCTTALRDSPVVERISIAQGTNPQ